MILKDKSFLLILLIAIILNFTGLSKPFSSKGEPREALVAQAMLKTGNWILPSRYGDEFATKPPFAHWMMATASSINGQVTELTSRLPSVLFSLAALIVFYQFIFKNYSEKTALLSSLILIFSVEWFRSANEARVDMILSATMLIGLIYLFYWYQRNLKGFPVVSILALSAGFLTKGPVALVLPLLIMMIFLFREGTKFSKIIVALLKFSIPTVVISSLWYIAAYLQEGEAFINTVLLENLKRFEGTMGIGEDPHTHTIWYLYGTLLLGFIPTTFVILSDLNNLIKKSFVSAKEFNFPKIRQFLSSLSSTTKFQLISILCFLIFFSIPSSKRSVYLLPIYPFLSFFLANYILNLYQARPIVFKRAVSTIFFIILFATILLTTLCLIDITLIRSLITKERAFLEIAFYQKTLQSFFRDISLITLFLCIALISTSLYGIIYSLQKTISYKRLATISVNGLFLLFFTLHYAFLPALSKSLSPVSFAKAITSYSPNQTNLYSYNARYYSLDFYLKGNLDLILDELPAENIYFVVVEPELRAKFLVNHQNTFKVEEILTSTNPIERTNKILSVYKVTRMNVSTS